MTKQPKTPPVDIDAALRHIDRLRTQTTVEYVLALGKLDNDERELLGLKRDDGEATEDK